MFCPIVRSLLGRHEQRHLLAQRHLEARVGEAVDALLRVVHGQGDTLALEVVHLHFGRLGAVLGRECQGELARARGEEVGRSVLWSADGK